MSTKIKQDLILFFFHTLFIYISVVYLIMPLMKIEPVFVRDFAAVLFSSSISFFFKQYLIRKSLKVKV